MFPYLKFRSRIFSTFFFRNLICNVSHKKDVFVAIKQVIFSRCFFPPSFELKRA